MSKIVIIGAGLSGLAAALHAQRAGLDYTVFEDANEVGGLCRSVEKNGYCFDYAGHLLHLRTRQYRNFVRRLLKEDYSLLTRRAYVYLDRTYTRYPFQANLFGLSAHKIQECLVGFIDAHYGSHRRNRHRSCTNFRTWSIAHFGRGIDKYFMSPYNEKLWTIPTSMLTCEWVSEFVPTVRIEDVVHGALFDSPRGFGYNSTFWYPNKGGVRRLCDAIAGRIRNVLCGQRVDEVDLRRRTIVLQSGDVHHYSKLISSMSLKSLVNMLRMQVPAEVVAAARALKHNSVFVVNLGIQHACRRDLHWVYLPEREYLPYRMGIYSNFASSMAPPKAASLYGEIAYPAGGRIDRQAAVRQVIEDGIRLGLIRRKSDVAVKVCFNIDCAYVIYDKYWAMSRKVILNYLRKHDIYSIGRYGNWEYSGMEEALMQGKSVVDEIRKA